MSAEDGGLSPALRAVWRHEDAPVARRRGLTVHGIVEAAVQLADAEGLAAVSMGRVAERLGFSPMALYRHVAGKDELLQLMFDRAAGEPPAVIDAACREGWRSGLERWSRELLAVLRRHPWALEIPLGGVPVTPNRLAWFDRGLHALEDTGLSEDEKAGTVLLLNGHVFWWARLEGDLSGGGRDDDGSGALLSSLVDAERFPALRRALDAGFLDDETDDSEWGLERILDGIGALVAQRSRA